MAGTHSADVAGSTRHLPVEWLAWGGRALTFGRRNETFNYFVCNFIRNYPIL